jgi:hypothetical protein
MTVPDGAQLSEDGKFWWDGGDWQPVPQGGEQSTQVGQLSEDGNWKWDGSDWQPADAGGQDHAGGHAGGHADGQGGDLAAALADKGIQLSPEAVDASYIQQVAQHVDSWYGGLDENSKAIVDALSQQGADTLLADPEVGVVAEGDPLITAFAGTNMTLNESLQATNQALEQTAAS